MKKEKRKKNLSVFKAFHRLVPPVFRAAPVAFTLYGVLSMLHGISWGLETMFQQRFFDTATQLATGQAILKDAFGSLLILALVNITCQILNGASNFMPEITLSKINGKLSLGIHEKIAKLSPIDFENTERLDDINKADNGKSNAVWFVFIFGTILSFYIPYFLFMSWYLFSLKPILAASVILVFIPTAATQIVRTKVFTKVEDKSAPIRRKYDYFESCMTSREYFKETRLLGGFRYFKTLYMDALDLLQKLKFKATMKTNTIELAMRAVTVGGYFGILYMLFDALMKQEITVGAFAAVFNSIGLLYGIMEEVVCSHIGSMAQRLGTIRNYLTFLDMAERKGAETVLPKKYDITLENVSFTYPGAEKPAVRDVSFTLKDGETLAVVGENGSGKSTLIRLITGLYLPERGNVFYDEINTTNISMSSLFANTSAVFQKYARYQMTLSKNIGISNTNVQTDEETLDSICTMSGLDKSDSSFTQGYETMLSREFDGVDLSGGQWQRVAIARGFFRNHHIIILDEPTAAIDPYEETRIYNRFAEISKNKTAVIVTHRLGSVKLADRIVVMKDGEVCQIGTHEELIHTDGEYSRLYTAQEQWYREEPVLV